MKEIFPDLKQVKYKGPDSKDPVSFKVYDPDRVVGGVKKMSELLPFSVAAWHSMCNPLTDMFGSGTITYPWASGGGDPQVEMRMRGLAEFAQKLQINYFCFHGRDLFTEAEGLTDQHANYMRQSKLLLSIMVDHNLQLGWGTENLFSHPRYAQGAFNSPYADVAGRAAAEVQIMLDITNTLGGKNYVLWGGRVGINSVLNQDVGKELDTIGHIYRKITDFAERNMSNIQLLEEPKGKEPTEEMQYSRDVVTTLYFLERAGVADAFKLNLECNHADLAGLPFQHEVHLARVLGNKIGGVDANSGAPHTGWDVDRYQESLPDAVYGYMEIDKQGGLGNGVINHDAKPRRPSYSIQQKAIGHIMAMDLWAAAVLTVERLKEDGRIESMLKNKYSSHFESKIGKLISGDGVFLSPRI